MRVFAHVIDGARKVCARLFFSLPLNLSLHVVEVGMVDLINTMGALSPWTNSTPGSLFLACTKLAIGTLILVRVLCMDTSQRCRVGKRQGSVDVLS